MYFTHSYKNDHSPFVLISKQAKHGYKIENWFQGAGMIPNRASINFKKRQSIGKGIRMIDYKLFPVNCKQRVHRKVTVLQYSYIFD